MPYEKKLLSALRLLKKKNYITCKYISGNTCTEDVW